MTNMSVPTICQAREGVSCGMRSSRCWARCICWHVAHLGTTSSMSWLIPFQNTHVRASNHDFSMSWWDSCNFARVSACRLAGITIWLPFKTMPSSATSSSRKGQKARSCGCTSRWRLGQPSAMTFKRLCSLLSFLVSRRSSSSFCVENCTWLIWTSNAMLSEFLQCCRDIESAYVTSLAGLYLNTMSYGWMRSRILCRRWGQQPDSSSESFPAVCDPTELWIASHTHTCENAHNRTRLPTSLARC